MEMRFARIWGRSVQYQALRGDDLPLRVTATLPVVSANCSNLMRIVQKCMDQFDSFGVGLTFSKWQNE
jgi:hypothetical protein